MENHSPPHAVGQTAASGFLLLGIVLAAMAQFAHGARWAEVGVDEKCVCHG